MVKGKLRSWRFRLLWRLWVKSRNLSDWLEDNYIQPMFEAEGYEYIVEGQFADLTAKYLKDDESSS